MKQTTALLALISLCLLSTMILISSAQERIVGVAEGDWFKYGNFAVSWNSDNPYARFPPNGWELLAEMNETEWMLMSVQNISSTSILLKTVAHYRNGTGNIDSDYADVNLGSGKMVFKVISANLITGDSVYSGTHYLNSKISQTINHTYSSGLRETNYMNQTRHMDVVRMNTETMNGTVDETEHWYWDRATGILVEYSSEAVEHIGNYTSSWSASYKLIESNLWTVQEPSTLLTAIIIFSILAFAIVAISVLIYKRKLKSS